MSSSVCGSLQLWDCCPALIFPIYRKRVQRRSTNWVCCVLKNTCAGVTCAMAQLWWVQDPAPGLCVTDLVPRCLLPWFSTFWSQLHKPQGANPECLCLSNLSMCSCSSLSAHWALTLFLFQSAVFMVLLAVSSAHCSAAQQIFGLGTL